MQGGHVHNEDLFHENLTQFVTRKLDGFHIGL